MEYGKSIYSICRARQEQMIKNGWRLELANDTHESYCADALYTRLIEEGYSKVNIYYSTSSIRGLHHYYAMCKR